MSRVTVTVCAGRSIAISPHPSGLSQLGPVYLREGESLQVEPAEAERLYRQGDILHPITNRPRPEPARHTGPTISYGDGRPIPVSDEIAHLNAARQAEAAGLAEAERQREAQRRNGHGPGMPDGWP